MTNIPKFQGKPLVELPENIPMANCLEDNFGKAVLNEYQGRVKSDYKNNRNLNILSYDEGLVKGSNPFAVVLINQILPENLRTATQADLEKILQTNALNLRGTYEDTAIIWRSNDNPNSYLATIIYKQIEQLTGEMPKDPVMINLNDLTLVEDPDSEYGLAFKIKENAEIITSKILDGKNNGKTFSKTKKYGLPIFNKNGDRTFYARDSGLSRLGLDSDLDLDSDWDALDNSDSGGRVVIVSGEATVQNLGTYITNLQKEKDIQIAKIEEKYQKALSILKE